MEKQLFRQQSVDRISSPEQLRDYLRVTSPRLWMVLIAIVVLLAGFIVYASTATMENTISVSANLYPYKDEDTGEGSMYLFIQLPYEQRNVVEVDMPVRFDGLEGRIISVSQENFDGLALSASAMIEGIPAQQIDALIAAYSNASSDSENDYSMTRDVEIVLESTTPISFLLN